ARTDSRPLRRRMDPSEYWTASLVDARRPVQLLDEGRGAQEFSVDAVEDVKKTIAVGLNQQMPRAPVERHVHHDGRLRGVVVEQVVGRELEVPLQLAGVRIEGQNAIRIKVVAGTSVTDAIGRRVAGTPVKRIQLGIVGAGHPRGAASVQVSVAWPTVAARLARARDGP